MEEPSECEIQDNHEAFAYPVVHQQPSPTGCYSAHAARVASVISPNNTMGNRGAGLAQLFYPNVGVPTGPHPFDQQDDTACSPWGTVSAYHWMVADHDVPTVNESYGCLGGEMCTEQVASGWEGITQDFYSRYYGTTIVKAAGNRDCFGVEDPACPFSLNSICVGSIDSDGDLSCKSSFHNPTHPTSSDREEPDVVAFGGGRDPGCNYVASAPCTAIPASGATAWSKSIGTSFAAPVVTSMVSLFKERCQQHFPFPLDQRVMRAHFRTWALLNVEGPAYSTPRPNVDLTDGAGVVLADLLALSCVPNGTYGNIGLVGGGVDLTQDNGPMPGGEAQYQNGWNPPGETQAMPHSGAKSFGYAPGPGSGRKWAALVQIPLPDGARVRATWSWDGCVPGVTGSAPGAVAIDFDLFLFNNSTNEYYWASQSLDDNNEGFDYTLQGGEGGDISIILAWPDGAQSCEGNTVDAGALSWLALW
ncbi:MAG: S8/S53 family peptidase [Polyangiaceae bacterium]